MSLATWMKQYMPYEAHECQSSTLDAIQHGIKKYEGLRPAALKKHKVKIVGGAVAQISNENEMRVILTMRECALCHRFHNDTQSKPCERCPLYIVGEHCLRYDSAYNLVRRQKRPAKLIKVLKSLEKQCTKSGIWKPLHTPKHTPK